MRRVLQVLLILLFLEIGVVLIIVPWWPQWWTKNFFASHYPWIGAVARNYFVRGAVSGIGLADIFLAIYELWRPRRA
ncbi:MAG TPA: hypothetical protein VN648_02330 [Candidatus Methylomirabilis sp.]|nr:hypothetical protein [Candidatus Methylomirabilis sp.]